MEMPHFTLFKESLSLLQKIEKPSNYSRTFLVYQESIEFFLSQAKLAVIRLRAKLYFYVSRWLTTNIHNTSLLTTRSHSQNDIMESFINAESSPVTVQIVIKSLTWVGNTARKLYESRRPLNVALPPPSRIGLVCRLSCSLRVAPLTDVAPLSTQRFHSS